MLTAMLDTETTGLLEDPDARVIEIACTVYDDEDEDLFAVMRGAEESDRFDTFVAHTRSWASLVRPDVITEEGLAVALAISGITEDQIMLAPSPKSVLGLLKVSLDGFRTPVRAWNLAFDQPMFQRTFCDDFDLPDPLRWDGCAMLDFTHRWRTMAGINVETMEPRWFSVKRASYAAHVPYSNEDAHRATFDTQLCACLDFCSRNGILSPPEQNTPTGPIVLGTHRRPNPANVKVGTITLGRPKAKRRDPRSVPTRRIVIGARR